MTSENMSTPHPMDSILIRRLKFAFEQVQTSDLVWSRSCPNFSIFINALGVHVPHFERFLVAVLREIRGDLANPQLASTKIAWLWRCYV